VPRRLVVRPSRTAHAGGDFADRSPADRLRAVWPLTRAAWALKRAGARARGEPPAPDAPALPDATPRSRMLSPDHHDMLAALADAGAAYLLVGAHALAVHGHPRATGDLDVWVRRTPANAARVLRALRAFGAPLAGVTASDFLTPDLVVQIGVAPHRVDLLTAVDGLTFEEAWPDRLVIDLDGLAVPVVSRAHLIRTKRATGRPQDLADVARLEADDG
jgi:hypothetical protein